LSRPFRYTFILVLVAVSTCLAAFGGWRFARASAPVAGPIVLVSIDALRADHLAAYGYAAGRSPVLDSLGADGVIFERAYSHVPQTLPSHVTMLSGRLPFETGVRDGVGATVPASERLVARMLSDRGFATGGVVSSFLLRAETGIDQGFHFFDAELPSTGDRIRDLHRNGADSERVAEKWLDSLGTTRAFLFLHLDEPRQAASADTGADDPQAYDTAITAADEVVGHLVRYLKTHQLYDQSTVIVVSDHGEGLGDHGEQGHGLFVYDDVMRVPLIIKPSAGQGAGRRVKSPVQLIDLVPTILDLAKAPVPGNLRGRSLAPLLDGDRVMSGAPIYGESVYARAHFGWTPLTSVVDEGYRYIAAPREELYDLTADPGERDNLFDAKPEIAARLRGRLKAFAAPAWMASPATVKQDVRERYEALGLVGVPSTRFVGPRETVDPKEMWPVLEAYRHAIDLRAAGDPRAVDAFRALARQQPLMIDLWRHLADVAASTDRNDLAVEAFRHVIQSEPDNNEARLGLATGLLRLRKLDEARQAAQRLANDESAGGRARADAHELLARIALAHHDLDLARSEAESAEHEDASRPVTAYVAGRIAFDARRYVEALEQFEAALAILTNANARPLGDLRL
jgi:arylsulfatase A-like enzyme